MFRTLLSIVALSTFVIATQGAGAQAPSRPPAAKAQPVPVVNVVNLNTASAKDLEVLPGVGAKTAERIIAYRQKNGPFKKIEELMNVQEIGRASCRERV